MGTLFAITTLSMLLCILLTGLTWDGKAPVSGEPTRAMVVYAAFFDGDGEKSDICLAGFRWYSVNYTFMDYDGADLAQIEVLMEVGQSTRTLLTYDPNTSLISQTDLQGAVSVRDGEHSVKDGDNLTFGFMMWVHLNWDLETSLKLIPLVRTNTSLLQLDTQSELSMVIWGNVEPVVGNVMDMTDTVLDEGATIRSGTTIKITSITLQYYHPTETFSSFHPAVNELTPKLNDTAREWNATRVSGHFEVELTVPRASNSKVTLTMHLEGVRADWQFRVKQWSFILYLDDVSPLITLKRPGTDQKVQSAEFAWEAFFQDYPFNSPALVNGSTLAFRVSRGGIWSDWTALPTQEDAKSVTANGTALGMVGWENTSIQFRAFDTLGNENVSLVFPVHVNAPPVVSIPGGLDGRTYLNNVSLMLNGYSFASDPDDAELRFEWYIDDIPSPLSTTANLNKTLFNVDPGRHQIMLVIMDRYETRYVSFNITVKEAPSTGDEESFIERAISLLTNQNFMVIAIPIALLVLVILLTALVIFIFKKTREQTDFVIDENNVMPASQAEEMARKLREMYDASMNESWTAAGSDAGNATIEDSTFDFDYNLYEVLGIESNVSDALIKKKYRDLAAFYHPDRVAQHKEISLKDAVEHMIKLNKAKEILLNPEMRAMYDASLAEMDFSVDINDVGEEVPGEDWS